MNASSLHVRLSAAAILSIIGALFLSGLFLMLLFERHLMRRVDQELSVYIKQLAATVEIAPSGEPVLASELADPRFRRPLSGLYWQIETDKSVVLRSRSLWDQSLELPAFNTTMQSPARIEIQGPNEEPLVVRVRTVFLETGRGTGEQIFRLAAGVNKNEVLAARSQFTWDLFLALSLLACALCVAAWLQVFFGLRPLKQIRQRINDIRTGTTSKLEGRYPEEVQMLVSEVNALLEANDKAIERARDSAADLAHGLKTPLAVLQAESRTLAEQQQAASAEEIAAQVEQMRVRVERHLAHVRMRGPSGGAVGRTDVRKGFDKIVKAMRTMPRGEDIVWHVDVPDDVYVAVDTQDFMEVFGNLLDNARKWAVGNIEIYADVRDDAVVFRICDDGPGIPDEKIADILKRGRRLDENKTGAGLGLSIAKKVVEAYGGAIELKSRREGGVEVSVSVPTAEGGRAL